MPYCIFLIVDCDHIVATERQFMGTAPFRPKWLPCPHGPLNKAISWLTNQSCPILSDGEHLSELRRFLYYEDLM